MVAERAERQPTSQEDESNVVKGPWKGPAYLDPDRADFFLPRISEEQGSLIRVYANAKCTAFIWNLYKQGLPKRDWPHLVMSWSGEPVWQDPEGTKATMSVDPAEVLQVAMNQGMFVYNFRRRRAWRPIWYPGIPVEERTPGNMSYEAVELYGYKSFIEGWEKRPRAKLFSND